MFNFPVTVRSCAFTRTHPSGTTGCAERPASSLKDTAWMRLSVHAQPPGTSCVHALCCLVCGSYPHAHKDKNLCSLVWSFPSHGFLHALFLGECLLSNFMKYLSM